MMALHYTNQSVLLTDDVCSAILHYAQALAATGGSDVVKVPAVTEAGETSFVEFLLGPSSQLYATPGVPMAGEARHPHVVEDLDRRSRMLQPKASPTPAGVAPAAEDFDLDAG